MLRERLHRYGLTESARRTHDKAQLRLDVQAGGRTEGGPVPISWPLLTTGPNDVGARDHDGAPAAVIADRHVLPVRHQRRGIGSEQPAEVGRVMLRGVEIDIVTY